jgi:hypothetical protein
LAALDPKVDDVAVKAHLQDLLAGYIGITDQPAILFTRELAELYPDAKVIVTVRDPEKWFRSIQVVRKTVFVWWLPIIFWPMPTLRWASKVMAALAERCV